MDIPATPTKSTNVNPLLRSVLLAYGGVAILQWVHAAMLGGADTTDLSGYANWLRDGTLALPFVAAAVLLGSRRYRIGAGDESMGITALFSAVMGAGFLLSQLFPNDPHAAHEGQELSTFAILQHTFLIMLVAGAYAMVVDKVLVALAATTGGEITPPQLRIRMPRRLGRVAWLLVALLVATPVFVFGNTQRAAAQTTFSDQVIHPRGTLNLFARALSDGSYAYVAPDYGAPGERPTIEMTEGETLNITLKNELPGDVSLHVHGVHYKLDSDGTRHTNSFVRPGQSRTYQWVAVPGTAGYWHYHDHVMGDDEGTQGILQGLYGALVVRKPGAVRPAHTFVIVGNDRTLNGRIYPDTPTYTARQGELVEWVVISHGNRVHTFHLHGHHWLTPNRPVPSDWAAASSVGSGAEDNHILAPGDSFGFMVIAGDGVGPGMWMYHCHFQDHAAAMRGFFNVLPPGPSAQEEISHFFPETGKTVSGRFLDYWKQNGGLAQQGYPISEPFQEKSDLDGKTYTVQYFERSVFEAHPENAKPYDVLLSQLGTFRYKEKYPGK